MEPVKKAVLNGGPKDIEEYRKKTGWLTGVHHVLDLPTIMWESLEAERAQRIANDAPLT
jgi:hypothetical protein